MVQLQVGVAGVEDPSGLVVELEHKPPVARGVVKPGKRLHANIVRRTQFRAKNQGCVSGRLSERAVLKLSPLSDVLNHFCQHRPAQNTTQHNKQMECNIVDVAASTVRNKNCSDTSTRKEANSNNIYASGKKIEETVDRTRYTHKKYQRVFSHVSVDPDDGVCAGHLGSVVVVHHRRVRLKQ